jgi:hypothetical protein
MKAQRPSPDLTSNTSVNANIIGIELLWKGHVIVPGVGEEKIVVGGHGCQRLLGESSVPASEGMLGPQEKRQRTLDLLST